MFVYLFCALAAVIGLAGGARSWRESRFTSAALLAGAVAVLAYAGAMAGNPLAFKVYYTLGASMFPGLVGAGSAYVAFSGRVARWPAYVVFALCALQVVLTLPAGVVPGTLEHLNGGNGEGILSPGPWILPTVLFNTFGLGFALVAALYAWWKAFRLPAADHAAMAIGLSVVVLGIMARSAGVYKALAEQGGGSAFMLADAAAFGLVWLGMALVRRLPRPIERLLFTRAPV